MPTLPLINKGAYKCKNLKEENILVSIAFIQGPSSPLTLRLMERFLHTASSAGGRVIVSVESNTKGDHQNSFLDLS